MTTVASISIKHLGSANPAIPIVVSAGDGTPLRNLCLIFAIVSLFSGLVV